MKIYCACGWSFNDTYRSIRCPHGKLVVLAGDVATMRKMGVPPEEPESERPRQWDAIGELRKRETP